LSLETVVFPTDFSVENIPNEFMRIFQSNEISCR